METFERQGIEYRPLGRTGESVSLLGIGGYHIGVPSEAEGIEIVRTALDQGVNFLDNAWDYGDGEPERRMGKALRDGYRDKAFLMTKIDGRTRDAAARQIDESMQRLGVDMIDLVQLHEIIRMEDPVVAFREDGAIEALVAARDEGKIRYIGFTGHKDPQVHLKMLATAAAYGFHFDTVQMPLNVLDAHYHSFEKQVLPALEEEGCGIIGMKALGGEGQIAKTGTVTATEAYHYAMNLPTATVVCGCDSLDVLHQALDAARSFEPLSNEQVQQLMDRTAEVAKNGAKEVYKTGTSHDGTLGRPDWLGVDYHETPARV